MSQIASSIKQQKYDAGAARVDMKLEVALLPVSDVDRAKEFSTRLGWRLDDVQEVTRRLPGRIAPATATFASANDLASAMRCAAAAHGEDENRNGQRDTNWPDWYAAYMAAEQAGTELPL